MNPETSMGGGQREFLTTQWSVILKARDLSSPEHRGALERLIVLYWKPVYFYFRRRGKNVDDAKDLTQDFFRTLLEKNTLAQVNPPLWKFKTFLRVAAKRFLSDYHDRTQALKRGGGFSISSLMFGEAESEFAAIPASNEDPDERFRKEWGQTILRRALARGRLEFKEVGRERWYEIFETHHLHPDRSESYEAYAAKLGVSETDVANFLHRTRQRLREIVIEELRQVVASDAEIEEELADLLKS